VKVIHPSERGEQRLIRLLSGRAVVGSAMAENVELVRGAYAAFGRGEIAAIIEMLDDSVRWSSPATLPQGGDFTGKDGAMRFFEGVGAAWQVLKVDLESLGEIDSGLVVAVVQGSGSLRKGEPAQYGAVHAFTVKDGKITSFREFVDVDRPLTG
jgi:ketosteroid isomerase-like protein